ncbi:MAG TPA: serine/threonine-protein kinase [Gemmatales bacterium]|nr:serine/threonine-protein kinase [Gemmatales bacterium]
MSEKITHRELTDADWQELDRRTDAFATASMRGPVSDWEDYLEGLQGSLRLAVLIEFIRTDMDLRWSQGRRVFVEDYTRRYPELSPEQLPLDLILEEWQQRHRWGDKPDKGAYLKRFPRHAAALEKKLKEEDKPLLAAKATVETATASSSMDCSANYMFIEPIGRGQTAEVWRARRLDGQELAIKTLFAVNDKLEARRELESLELVLKLRHHHLLSILGYWIESQRLYIVMELAEGNLGTLLQRYKHMQLPGIPRQELLRYFHEASLGLDYLHQQGICHRDVKPDNLLLQNGNVKVADFGLARVEPLPQSSTSMVGTPAYMAPEAWRGHYCIASDQYSLAASYVELRTGQRAIPGNKFVDVMMGHLQGTPHLEGVSPEEQKALMRAMSKNPESRFASCEEFVRALAGLF